MTETRFTPGPWKVEGTFVYALDVPLPNLQGKTVHEKLNRMSASVSMYSHQTHCEDGEAEANAHLIAAAPELYSLLQLMLTHGEHCNWFADRGDYELVEQAEAVLAKARGETP